MRVIFLSIITFFYTLYSYSQTIERQKIGVFGMTASTNNGSYDFSGGESSIMLRKASNPTGKYISDGLLQPPYQGVKIIGNQTYCESDSILLFAYGKTSPLIWTSSLESGNPIGFDVFFKNIAASKSHFIFVENANARDSIPIFIRSPKDCGKSLIIYEYLTPNNDGKNDTFYIENIEISPENSLVVYDQWGNQLIKLEDFNNDWLTVDFEPGIYVYIFEDFTNDATYKGKLLVKK